MSCGDIKKKLKAFLEDLLSENEFKEFCRHLESCSSCRQYVRSIGSLSNQLWKLGKVKVPSDFISTVLFALKAQKQSRQHNPFSKKQMAGFLALILAVLLVYLAWYYARSNSQYKKTPEPTLTVSELIKQEMMQEDMNGAPRKQYAPIVIRVEPPKVEAEPEEENNDTLW